MAGNYLLDESEFTFQILLVSDATAAYLAIITSKWSSNRSAFRVTYQDFKSRFWLSKKAISQQYLNSIDNHLTINVLDLVKLNVPYEK